MLSAIEERMDEPTARGLAAAVGRAVGDGVIIEGDKLPPIRTVATQLGLSPTTVSAAWALLVRSGTIHTAGRRGTLIAARRAGPTRYRRALDVGTPFALDLSTGTPDPDLLPDIRPALRRVERTLAPSTYLDEPVLPELAELLHADWPFPAERITVVDGAMDGLQLIVATHLRFGDRVAVEQPSFPPLLDLLESVGAAALPVGVDDDGALPDDVAEAVSAGARAVFLQPRAQNPTGASLSRTRARQLVAVLRDSDVVVIEDDSAGTVANTPTISLGTKLAGRTLHVRSYSKSHGPDLRLAAVGGPAALVEPLVDRRFLGQGWTSRLLQSVLVDLLSDAESIRTVEAARSIYAERRAAIVDALAAHGLTVAGRDGLNIWIPVQDEPAALLRLATQGVGVAAGAPFSVGNRSNGHIRVTTGVIRADHDRIASLLADAAQSGAWASPR